MQEKKFDSFCLKFSEKWQKFISLVTDKLFAFQSGLETKNVINIVIIALLCVSIFAAMYITNKSTPFAADDFLYHYIHTRNEDDPNYPEIICEADFHINGRVQSISDIVKSMKAHYYTMNGRLFLHSLVQLMLLWGKQYFNFINSAMYVALLLLIYKHCVGKKPKVHNAVLFAAIGLAVWTFAPAWGITNVWLDGSINYLWGSVIRLTALLPFRLYADDGVQKRPLLALLPMLILCTAAGATNENTGAAFIGMCVLYLIYYAVNKMKIRLWQVTGIIGTLVGFAFTCLSPANSNRVEFWNQRGNSIIKRITHIPANYIRFIGVFLGMFFVLSLFLYFYGKKNKEYKIGIPFIYLLGSIGGAFVMVAAPYFPPRAWYGIAICAIISVCSLLSQIKITPQVMRLALTIGIVFWTIWGAVSYAHMIKDARNVMKQYNERVEYIEEQKALGNYDVYLSRLKVEDEHSPLYGVTDLGQTPNDWQNVTKAMYYGLHSITTVNTR